MPVNHELPDIQAAVMKASAGTQGQEAVTADTSAVQQDLAVMADQAKGYTQDINSGLVAAQQNSAALNARLEEERRQADALRAAQRASASAAYASSRRSDEEEMLKAQKAAQEAAAADVIRRMTRDMPPSFVEAALEIIPNSIDYSDAVAALKSREKYGGIGVGSFELGRARGGLGGSKTGGTNAKALILDYARQYHNALQGGAAGWWNK